MAGKLSLTLARTSATAAPASATLVISAAGSFAAIATLLGSPLAGAFLLMEAAGLGGAMMGVVLVPGLLAAGIGSLIFVGLGDWTGFGTFSLAVPDIPTAGSPDVAQFLWAIFRDLFHYSAFHLAAIADNALVKAAPMIEALGALAKEGLPTPASVVRVQPAGG